MTAAQGDQTIKRMPDAGVAQGRFSRLFSPRGNVPSRSTVHPGMKLLLSTLVLALGVGFVLPATNAYAWWCGPNRWCGPGPRVGVYAPPGVGFWWGRSWYPYRWRPGWDPGWRPDPRRNYCDWHRC
jgi:hypothetical protein